MLYPGTFRPELKRAVIALCMAVIMTAEASAAPSDPHEGGQWGPLIVWPHIAVSAANLPDGRVLTWSGSERETWPTTEQTYSATWNPANNEFIEVFHEGHNMFCAHLAMLEDGRVFVNGGRNQTNSPWTSLFDYRDNGWVQIENMASGGRWYPTSVALADGDVFTAIGTASLAQYPERWDAGSGWQIQNGINFADMVLDDYFATNTHGESRWWPLLHVAPNGKLFHSGPTPKMHYIDTTGNGSYEQEGGEFDDWYHKHGTTIMYDEGKLLTAGGWVGGNNGTSTNKSFTVDLNGIAPDVQIIAPMIHPRKFQNGVMLPTGEVLVVGGNTSGQKFSDNGSVLAPEQWDPQSGQWRELAQMAVGRNYHSVALLLTDGRVLAAGGGYCSNSVTCNGSSHRDGQVYSPYYLFNADDTLASRPSITSGPGKISGGNTYTVNATPDLSYFSLIKMSSTSHGMNTDVRFLKMPHEETSPGVYEVTAHSNQNVLTPGYWMLFGVDAHGVPSEAHVMQINAAGLPWIQPITDQADVLGATVSLQLLANDADNDPVTFSATGLPPGLAISADGLISGSAQSEGTFSVTITVSDNDEGSRERFFNWSILGAGAGSITREWWNNISGGTIADLTGNVNFPDNPSGTELITQFSTPVNIADEYGTRVHGFLVPQTSGDYTFWLSTDDNGELWLSSNDKADNKELIASVPGWSAPGDYTKYAEQQSAPVTLVAGQRYYIEALQVEGGGGDHVEVAWATSPQGTPQIIDGANLAPYVEIIDPPASLEVGIVPNVGSEWTTVTLADDYSAMVVVATVQYMDNTLPAVARVRNAEGNSFEVRVQNPSGAALSGYRIQYMVSEEGRFDLNGDSFEAVRYASDVTDFATSSWVGEARTYLGDYTAPVVLGQVMSANDSDWSVFWAYGDDPANPPSAGALHTGKHVGEDPDTTRQSELVGYMVFEAGSGSIGSLGYTAALGADTIEGYDNPPSEYTLAEPASAAVLSSAAMDGNNGGWPVLTGSAPFVNSAMTLVVDEDQLDDPERTHTDESVAYVAFSGDIVPDANVELVVPAPAPSDGTIDYSVESNVDYLLYKWNFGDGSQETVYTDNPQISHDFPGPGRYVVILTIQNPYTLEETTQTFVQLVHAPLTANRPAVSSTIATHAGQNQVWNVNPDNDSVTVIDAVSFERLAIIPVGENPASLAVAPNGNVWVANKDSATISIVDSTMLAVVDTIELPVHSQPHGLTISPLGDAAFVALEASGDVMKLDAQSGAELATAFVATNVRHVSVSADGQQVLVSQFITPPLPNEASAAPVVESDGTYFGGQVHSLDTSLTGASVLTLRHSDRGVSEHTGPGVPNYLGPAVISPDGLAAWVPSKQDNVLAGELRGGQGMTFDQTVRAVTSKLDLVAGDEQFAARIDHDNAGVGSHGAFGPYGAHLFVSLEGNREVVINDVYGAAEMLRIDVGRAPQGLAVSDDGDTLFVHNFMDRSVTVLDVSDVVHLGELEVAELAQVTTVVNEALDPVVLLGKQHFYDARDPRLAGDSYMSCASCHNEGREDGRVWDFTGVGEGLRNTITLAGRGGMQHGFLHWSANFDELQDFEGQIRQFAGGTGLMADADFDAGTRSEPMGDPKTGLSADLDALAAYMSSLHEADPSPRRGAAVALSAEAELGRQQFTALGCDSCHTPPRYTDSALVNLHDVGTMTSASGQRLDGPLDGIDTPSLISVWQSPPYLHDGSAFDLTEAIAAHTTISTTALQRDQISAYLLELDAQTAVLLDDDSDGIYNHLDNCSALSNPDQLDTNGDGFGNRCDADLNNDCVINFLDMTILQASFLSTGQQDADFNGDGVVNFLDISQIATVFLGAPGPSGLAECN